jgi:Skp family chaperone for outer membrane proteins
MSRTLLAALLCAALAAPAGAATYKWTDTNGRVVYSDIPPQGNVKYETIGGAAPPANPNAVQELAAKELELRKRQTDAADRDKKTQEQQAALIKRAEQCQRADSNVRQLSADQVALVRYNEKGEAFVVDEATRRRERTEIEVWIRQNCGPNAVNAAANAKN